MLRFTTAIPPSTNHLYATVRGRRVLSKDGRAYKQALGLIVQRLAADQGFAVASSDRLALAIDLWFADHRRRDIANCEKILTDTIAAACGFDDCRIDDLHIRRCGIDRRDPRCEVRLCTIGATE